MCPFDHDKQTILMLCIQVLWNHLFQRKVFPILVFWVVDNKSSFPRHNENTYFLCFVSPPINNNFNSHIYKLWV